MNYCTIVFVDNSMAVLFVILKLTLKDFSIVFSKYTEPLELTVIELSFIFVTILKFHVSLAVVSIVFELSDIHVACAVRLDAMALYFAIFEFTIIPGPIRHFINSTTVKDVILEISFVGVTI